jgi:ABC-type bacteriocin/lantibiotic exporter with double-glycine peptidase domain
MGVVLQAPRLNAGSIYDNVACGGRVTTNEVLDAVERAGLAADVADMPMGLHTVVSEGGTNLSGGQRQRLLIARALLHRPRILLLDEATSSLDNKTQADVLRGLEALEVTRVIVAHRLETVQSADRILVISEGRLVEEGTFEKLLEKGGVFADLVHRQLGAD